MAAAVGFGWAAWTREPLVAALSALLLGGFVTLVVRHGSVERARRRADGLYRIDDEAAHRLARRWDALSVRHAVEADPDHPYAADLDLFGRASLFQLLDVVGGGIGEDTLRRWLLATAPPATVRERQAAVAELAPSIDLRDELAWYARRDGAARPELEPFLAWAEGDPWLRRRRALLWAARLSPIMLAATFVAETVGLVATPIPIWSIFLLANLYLDWKLVGPARRTLAFVTSLGSGLRSYADAFALLEATLFAAPALRRLQETLKSEARTASDEMRRLQRLTGLAFPSGSMLYPIAQAVTLWDVHALALLEGWQTSVGPRARSWLAALGEAEALAALAVLVHDGRDWVLPTVDEEAIALEARGLGHPLLAADVRVVNDVVVGPPGSVLFVTGSNMSGKSTLLRAIGVNTVLAGAGGPVCATEMRLPPATLWTSMRVEDSLAEGVSFFMAELRRLKAVVDAAGGAPRLLYLLDEILQGTNTTERQVAARHVIGLLIQRGAIGAVSTHDLTLAAEGPIADAAQPFYLTETIADGVEGARMSFDYKLRPGIARSTNALRLLEMVGFPSPEPTPGGGAARRPASL